MPEIKAYALALTTEECFDAINTVKGNQLLELLKSYDSFVGIHQEVDSQVFLFKNKKDRNNAHSALKSAGWNSTVRSQIAYVDSKYVKKEIENESNA